MLGALTWYTFYRKRTHFMSDLYCLALCQWFLLRLSWDECFCFENVERQPHFMLH
eukprot:UN05951